MTFERNIFVKERFRKVKGNINNQRNVINKFYRYKGKYKQ